MKQPLLFVLILLTGLTVVPAAYADSVQKLKDEGNALAQEGDFEGAQDKFEQAAAQNPQDPEAVYLVGLADLYMRNFQEAAKTMEQAVQMDSSKCKWHYYLGQAREMHGNLYGAIDGYNSAIECDPGYALAWQGRGYIRGLRLGMSSDQSGINDLLKAASLFDEQGDKDKADESRRMVRDICNSSSYTREGCEE